MDMIMFSRKKTFKDNILNEVLNKNLELYNIPFYKRL